MKTEKWTARRGVLHCCFQNDKIFSYQNYWRKVLKNSITVSAVLAALLTFGASAPALAAQTRTLPAGESLFAVDCENTIGQVASVDVTTAAVTALSAGNPGRNQACAADGGWDPVSGFAYYAALDNEPNNLFKVDVTSGLATDLGEIDFPAGSLNTVNEVSGGIMFDAAGVAYISFRAEDSNGFRGQWVGELNVTNGDITNEQKLTVGGTWIQSIRLYSGDFNPADGKFYLIDDHELLEVNMATGVATSHGDKGDKTVRWYGLAIDSNGVLWSTGSDAVTSSTVAGWATAGTEQISDNLTMLGAVTWYSKSNFIVGRAALAETGLDSNVIALTAAAWISAGVALLAVRRRVRA